MRNIPSHFSHMISNKQNYYGINIYLPTVILYLKLHKPNLGKNLPIRNYTCRFIHSGHIEDTIGVNVKSNLNLWHTPGCWGNTGQLELAQKVVVLGHGTLTLKDLDKTKKVKIMKKALVLIIYQQNTIILVSKNI